MFEGKTVPDLGAKKYFALCDSLRSKYIATRPCTARRDRDEAFENFLRPDFVFDMSDSCPPVTQGPHG